MVVRIKSTRPLFGLLPGQRERFIADLPMAPEESAQRDDDEERLEELYNKLFATP